jgi:hypothetical protein
MEIPLLFCDGVFKFKKTQLKKENEKKVLTRMLLLRMPMVKRQGNKNWECYMHRV